MLSTKAAEEQRIADSKISCYFAAHAYALEVIIALKETPGEEAPAFDYRNYSFPTLEYEYRATETAATRTNDEVTKASTLLKTLQRLLAKIKPKKQPAIEADFHRPDLPPLQRPAEIAEQN
uniref:HEPN domain-containing protein n=1 Tax=Peronospora matthiolae TaxID=2874970 RepID=A0AAV1TDD2_9STRA